MKKRLLHWTVLLLFMFFLIGIVCTCAELYVRSTGKMQTYSEKSYQMYRSPYTSEYENWYRKRANNALIDDVFPEFMHRYWSNNEGCRDTNFSVVKTRYRIITAGDSFNECLGSSNDSTWQKQCMTMLPDTIRHQVEIWNTGSAGADAVAVYKSLRDRFIKYHPDLYLMQINSSDIGDIKVRGGFERFNTNGTVTFKKPPWTDWLFERSHLFRALMNTRILHTQLLDEVMIPIWNEKKSNQQASDIISRAIDSARLLCQKNNCKFMVVFHPQNWEIEQERPSKTQLVIDYCRDKKIPYLDLRNEYEKLGVNKNNFQRLYWPIDGHHNNVGYGMFARTITPTLVNSITTDTNYDFIKK